MIIISGGSERQSELLLMRMAVLIGQRDHVCKKINTHVCVCECYENYKVNNNVICF